MNIWDVVAIVYGFIALATLLPAVIPIFRDVKPIPGDADSCNPSHFSEVTRRKWSNYYSPMLVTLNSWRKQAAICKRFHYYCVNWTILSSWFIPTIGTTHGDGEAKWLIVVVSSHVALALSFHRGLKVSENLNAFRVGESDFHDLNRRLEHQPTTLGNHEEEQLKAYIEAAEDIRKNVRASATKGLANIELSDNRRV